MRQGSPGSHFRFDAHAHTHDVIGRIHLPRLGDEPPECSTGIRQTHPQSSFTTRTVNDILLVCDPEMLYTRQTLTLATINHVIASVSSPFRAVYSTASNQESTIIDHCASLSAYCMHPYSRGGASTFGKPSVTGVWWPLLCCKPRNPATQQMAKGLTSPRGFSILCRHWCLIYYGIDGSG